MRSTIHLVFVLRTGLALAQLPHVQPVSQTNSTQHCLGCPTLAARWAREQTQRGSEKKKNLTHTLTHVAHTHTHTYSHIHVRGTHTHTHTRTYKHAAHTPTHTHTHTLAHTSTRHTHTHTHVIVRCCCTCSAVAEQQPRGSCVAWC